MRNSIAFSNTLAVRPRLKTGILIGLCCYVALLCIIALTHDHDHCEHAHAAETCAACFYNSQHVGEEIEFFALVSPFLPNTVLPLYEDSVFLPLRLTTNTRSRAPPVFSNELPDFVWEQSLFLFYIAMLSKGFGSNYTRPPFARFCFIRYSAVWMVSLSGTYGIPIA